MFAFPACFSSRLAFSPHREDAFIVLCHASIGARGCKGCNPLTGVWGCVPAFLPLPVAAGDASQEA